MSNIELEVCGGCNAKIPQESLGETLSSIKNFKRDDVLIGYDTMDDCALVRVDKNNGIVSTLFARRWFLTHIFLDKSLRQMPYQIFMLWEPNQFVG